MRYIEMQNDIALTTIDGTPIRDDKGAPASLTFKNFLLSRLTDPSFAKDMAAVLSAVQIRDALNVANGVLALESADWERLRDATKSPQGGYNPAVAHCLFGYMRAIVEANEKAPLVAGPSVTTEDAN